MGQVQGVVCLGLGLGRLVTHEVLGGGDAPHAFSNGLSWELLRLCLPPPLQQLLLLLLPGGHTTHTPTLPVSGRWHIRANSLTAAFGHAQYAI